MSYGILGRKYPQTMFWSLVHLSLTVIKTSCQYRPINKINSYYGTYMEEIICGNPFEDAERYEELFLSL